MTELTVREREVLDVLKRSGKTTSAVIAAAIGCSEQRARNYLNELRRKDVPIMMSTPGGRNSYAEYWLGDITATADYTIDGGATTTNNAMQQPVVIRMPEIKLQPYEPKVAAEAGDPESMVVLLSDLHAGEITSSYNSDVFRARMRTLMESVLTIVHLHREMYPINDITVIDLGDNIHGENPYQGGKIGSVECGEFDQVFKIALPALVEFLSGLRQEFATVRFCGVRGNHGRSKLAPETSNADLMLYRALDGLPLPDGIDIRYSEDFKQIVDVRGFRFFCFHGDQVQTNYGLPFYGITRKVLQWYQQYDGFNYSCCGHWHCSHFLRLTKHVKHFINGSLATDDPFSLERVGQSALPVQTCFGVHERNGVTWTYELVTDEDFFPVKWW